MLEKKALKNLVALSLCAFAVGAEAVSLGDMEIESTVDQPFEARLSIEDTEKAAAPYDVRLAPLSVYQKAGKTPAPEMDSLHVAGILQDGVPTLRIYSDKPVATQDFPLFVEMHSDGVTTLREYRLTLLGNRYIATTQMTKTLLGDQPEADKNLSSEDVAKATREEDEKFIYKTARSIVREHIAANGFDPAGPMRIKEGMTLWSVARVYWPQYRGATAEQLLIGFRDANPKAFADGNPGQLQTGADLYPPKAEAVFAVNPVEAFKEIHGNDVAIPLSTQNLIDAQLVSIELAGLVADAQSEVRAQGKNAQEIARAGRRMLEDRKGELSYEKNLVTDDGKPLGATREALTRETKSAARTDLAAEKAEPADAAVATDENEAGGFKMPWHYLAVVGALLLAALYFLRGRSCCCDKDDEKKKVQKVTVQKQIEPTSKAQITAVKSTVDEAVKNGTTGGAMGAGVIAFAEARKSEAEEKADESVPEDTEEHSQEKATVSEPVKDEDMFEDKPVFEPFEPEATGLAQQPETAKEKPEAEPEKPHAEHQPLATEKEKAYSEALDARIDLAEGFIKYGALQEANEVFDEVMHRGTPEQKLRVEEIRRHLEEESAK